MARLLVNVLLLTTRVAPNISEMAPPAPTPPSPPMAWLPAKVLPLTVALPSLRMPPPNPKLSPTATLPRNAQSITVRVSPGSLKMPAPWSALPLIIARPAMVALTAGNVEDSAGAIAADCRLVRAQPFDVQVCGNRQLPAGQGDSLSLEAVGEVDRVAAAGDGDGGPQRAGAAVQVVQDGEGARQPAIFKCFQPRPERRPFARRGPLRATGLTGMRSFPVVHPGREPHDTSPFTPTLFTAVGRGRVRGMRSALQ